MATGDMVWHSLGLVNEDFGRGTRDSCYEYHKAAPIRVRYKSSLRLLCAGSRRLQRMDAGPPAGKDPSSLTDA